MKRFGIGALLGGIVAFFFDPDRGRARRTGGVDRSRGLVNRGRRRAKRVGRAIGAEAYGMSQRVQHLKEEPKTYDDVTLAHKVESELFRPAGVPKGRILVNAVDGFVQLRGEADTPEMIDALVRRTRKIQGVREVESLLHLPGA